MKERMGERKRMEVSRREEEGGKEEEIKRVRDKEDEREEDKIVGEREAIDMKCT